LEGDDETSLAPNSARVSTIRGKIQKSFFYSQARVLRSALSNQHRPDLADGTFIDSPDLVRR
jgi:hypothetical protein